MVWFSVALACVPRYYIHLKFVIAVHSCYEYFSIAQYWKKYNNTMLYSFEINNRRILKDCLKGGNRGQSSMHWYSSVK